MENPKHFDAPQNNKAVFTFSFLSKMEITAIALDLHIQDHLFFNDIRYVMIEFTTYKSIDERIFNFYINFFMQSEDFRKRTHSLMCSDKNVLKQCIEHTIYWMKAHDEQLTNRLEKYLSTLTV